MVLAWKQPTFIGGMDVTGYFVDYREVVDGLPGKWHEANVRAISERAYRVSGYLSNPSRPLRDTFTDTILVMIGFQVSDLKENRKYQFQVRAANIAGVGVPSLPSDTFLCEEWTIAVPGSSAPCQSDRLISNV